jgi:hypothetical protein
VIAHQRRIREEMKAAHPRTPGATLQGYSIETISRADALPLIVSYEWLGNIGRNVSVFIGLLSPQRELEGVACFGQGPQYGPSNVRQMIGNPTYWLDHEIEQKKPKAERKELPPPPNPPPAYCLERGACVHYAPPNAASYLISAACKLVRRLTGVTLFFAYADPMAGEYGGVYQATNWFYLGQGLWGKFGFRSNRYFVLPPGADGNVASNWRTSRILRPKNGKRLSWPKARKLGWVIAEREAKHVYAINIGRDQRKWRKQIHALQRIRNKGTLLTYPAPTPELKRKHAADVRFTIPAPPAVQPDLFRRDCLEIARESVLTPPDGSY